LRQITLEHDIMFIVDEVQSGVGITGKFWGYQHAGIVPDMITFGKKLQVCGFLCSTRVDEVDSVFKVPSRINSTWGGNLVDMVRATRYLQVIEEEGLVENSRVVGDYLLGKLHDLRDKYAGKVTNSRGKGVMNAFDLPDTETRTKFLAKAKENGVRDALGALPPAAEPQEVRSRRRHRHSRQVPGPSALVQGERADAIVPLRSGPRAKTAISCGIALRKSRRGIDRIGPDSTAQR
jgi:acetylornithine/succinyldiaminopimelate/putrescine aminotransferase